MISAKLDILWVYLNNFDKKRLVKADVLLVEETHGKTSSKLFRTAARAESNGLREAVNRREEWNIEPEEPGWYNK
jgi:hypothetical protein